MERDLKKSDIYLQMMFLQVIQKEYFLLKKDLKHR